MRAPAAVHDLRNANYQSSAMQLRKAKTFTSTAPLQKKSLSFHLQENKTLQIRLIFLPRCWKKKKKDSKSDKLAIAVNNFFGAANCGGCQSDCIG